MNATTQMKQHGAGAPVHIETNGFILRSLTAADATPRFLQWINSPEFLSGLNLRALNFTHEKLVRYIESFDNRNGYLVGIFAPQTRLLLGLYTLDVNLMHKVGNITTGIGEHAYEGKGMLWATIDALLDHFFAYRDIEKITARVYPVTGVCCSTSSEHPALSLKPACFRSASASKVNVLTPCCSAPSKTRHYWPKPGVH